MAKTLIEKKNIAMLIDEATGVKLTIPPNGKVFWLKTTIQPHPKGVYWMIFGA